MSLYWDVSNVTDYENVCFEQREDGRYVRPVTNAIVMTTMAIDMSGIVTENVEEFAWRMDLYQRMFGGLLVEADDNGFHERFITTEEVRAHLGLHTNVATQSRASWLKRMAELHHRDFVRDHPTKERA
jgi:hypothetical protein